MKKYLVAIDPSINNLGYAVFNGKKLIECGLFKCSKRSDTYLTKAREMIEKVHGVCNDISKKPVPWGNLQIVTEIPQHFGSGGYLARESGDVYKLTFICGMIYNIVDDVIAYTPNEWKQQLPKCVVRNRLAKLSIYGKVNWFKKTKRYCDSCKKEHWENDLDHNIVDAIGIGHKHLFGRV